MIVVLWLVAIITLAYAVYRSTGEVITVVENGRQIIYGEPQHGLILGLCIIAGVCIAGTIPLWLSKEEWRREEAETLSKRKV